MKMRLWAAILLASTTFLSSAYAQMFVNGQKVDNVEIENIQQTLSYTDMDTQNWFYKYQINGFHIGAYKAQIIPITKEVYELMESLDKSKKYKCSNLKLTAKTDFQDKGYVEQLFVLSMDCEEI
tara:strand:+ start:1842 stop:2213 length:372 start_codon:yes stop_codon:yes gene_type:complete